MTIANVLIVYRCYDDQEEESCFLSPNDETAKSFMDTNPAPPDGFEDRPGYYFFERVEVTFVPLASDK
jgi:hypothetical protein